MSVSRADAFLQMIRRSQRGRLKIYLGYCAGVGKTYQMLLEGRRLKDSGIDVVVGFVEAHGRRDTERLVEGLEVVPRRRVTYRGITIEEMDLDAVLARRPVVALIDELAHTNVPGSKNSKRYQDVEDLLASGIHVISTLNVQHLESLFNTIERDIGVKVRERIPDRVVMDADQIVNIDVTTEDLRQRLKDGKIYPPGRAELALESFFRDDNLAQLREITLRELAAHIDFRRRESVPEEPPATPDQVLVCLSSRGPNSEALLRYGSRLAGRLNRNWYALYVQTSAESPTHIDAKTQRILGDTLALAQQLGATVFTYRGDDIVKTILQFAKEYGVGHLVLGRPGPGRGWWRRVLGRSGPVERLLREARGLNVVVVDTGAGVEARRDAVIAKDLDKSALPKVPQPRLSDYVSPETILIWRCPLTKQEVLPKLVRQSLGDEDASLYESALEAVLQREAQGSTFAGSDVGIPHARVRGLTRPRIAIGIAPDGVTDETIQEVARVVVLLLSPESENELHLKLLALIAQIARDPRLTKQLAEAPRAEDVLRGLLAAEEG